MKVRIGVTGRFGPRPENTPEAKRCPTCKSVKPRAAFSRHRNRPDGLASACRECKRSAGGDYHKAYRQRNAVKFRAYMAPYSLMRIHGMTADEYARRLAAQGGVCAICRNPETKLDKAGAPQRLSVDHDHGTELRRGLLCHSCNLRVARMEWAFYSPDPLRDATERYLTEWRSVAKASDEKAS